MRILRGHEFPDSAWRGFRVVGDTLWTPEGRSFKPSHMVWWSLTCRMADQFRVMVRSDVPVLLLDEPVVALSKAGAMPDLGAEASALAAATSEPVSIGAAYHEKTFSPVGTGEKGVVTIVSVNGGLCPGSNTGQKGVAHGVP